LALVKREGLLALLDAEAQRADARYGVFRSTHEGLGVLVEEFDELRAAIRSNDLDAVQYEALQVAAVALRLVEACANEETADRSLP
jgi:NTP pyrophosphatase (non-canonical NTP hydrolase)